MSDIKHPKEVDKLYYDEEISICFFQAINNYANSIKNQKYSSFIFC